MREVVKLLRKDVAMKTTVKAKMVTEVVKITVKTI